MIDSQHEARAWADFLPTWSRFVGGLWRDSADAFQALAAIQYAAPWKAKATGRCR
jgi:hypothetical protein